MRFAMGLEYDGSGFFGWQIQALEPTVQGCVQQALTVVANHPVEVTCCGRTDTGVHAICQVVHFDSTAERSERSWVLGVNSHLPPGVSALWLKQLDESFNARFTAYSRTYRYRILNRWIRPALDVERLSWCRQPLDADLMNQAAQHLRGKHDFSAFRAAACQATHAVREIQEIAVSRRDNEVILDVSANGFLYHMVRNIAGSLMAVGRGDQPVHWISELLEGKDRTVAAPTAAPNGLYFKGARYPEKYDIPSGAVDFPHNWNQT